MHVENMLYIADVIEKCEPRPNIQGWNMGAFIEDASDGTCCGTAGCVASWTVAVLEPDTFTKIEQFRLMCCHSKVCDEVELAAERILALPDYATDFLFYGKWLDLTEPLRLCSSTQVAAIMRDMVREYQKGTLSRFISETTHKSHQ